MDNCTAQNKKLAALTGLLHVVNSEDLNLNKATIKYLEKRHTLYVYRYRSSGMQIAAQEREDCN